MIKLNNVTHKSIEALADISDKHNVSFEYKFLDDLFMAQFKKERTMQLLANYFSFISIFISVLGLISVTSLDLHQKSKEFTIRKIFGANFINIAKVVLKDYAIIIAIAILISIPIMQYSTHYWLQNFAYQVKVSFHSYLILYVSIIGLLAAIISIQVYLSLKRNSVDGLKYD